MDPDISLGGSPGPDDTMAPTDSTGHPNQLDLGGGTTLRSYQGHRLCLRPWVSL